MLINIFETKLITKTSLRCYFIFRLWLNCFTVGIIGVDCVLMGMMLCKEIIRGYQPPVLSCCTTTCADICISATITLWKNNHASSPPLFLFFASFSTLFQFTFIKMYNQINPKQMFYRFPKWNKNKLFLDIHNSGNHCKHCKIS